MIKKIYALVCVGVMAAFSVNAQETKTGFRLGATYSQLGIENDVTYVDRENGETVTIPNEARIGALAAFYVDHKFSEHFGIQPEIQYAAQGSKAEEFRADYINLPVLLEWRATEKFHIGLGPQVGLAIWDWKDRDQNLDKGVDFESFEYGATASIQFEIIENLVLDARYYYGLSQTVKDQLPYTGGATNNGVFHFGVAYQI